MLDALTFGALVVCAGGLGWLVLSAIDPPAEGRLEFAALCGAAGFGLLGVVLGVLALFSALPFAAWLIPGGAVLTLVGAGYRLRGARSPAVRLPAAPALPLVFMMAGACLGAIAPVTEYDSLAGPIPISLRIAQEGAWRFWPDLAHSVYPLAQEMLTASLIVQGNSKLGALSAAELVLAAVLITMLAGRIAVYPSSRWIAAIVALGCPAVAFIAASTKEDALVILMTVAGTLALTLRPDRGSVMAAGLFAGLAAGAKYTGLPIALALVVCVPFCCGRSRPLSSLLLALAMSVASGGLWYGVNLLRFGNPLVPLLPSLGRFPVTPALAHEWFSGFGYGRSAADALRAPFRMAREVLLFETGEFGGRGNWINPMVWLGVPAALFQARRRSMIPVLAVSASLYVTWFFHLQNARLLLPAACLLAIPAADLVVATCSRMTLARYAVAPVLAMSIGIVAVVGGIRAQRYISDADGFLERETEHYAAIQWMNTHLDPSHDRVLTSFPASGYLQIPWMSMSATRQVEVPEADFQDPERLSAALRSRGFTHVFGASEGLGELRESLSPVYSSVSSRLGGSRFFRNPPTVPVGVFSLTTPSR